MAPLLRPEDRTTLPARQVLVTAAPSAFRPGPVLTVPVAGHRPFCRSAPCRPSRRRRPCDPAQLQPGNCIRATACNAGPPRCALRVSGPLADDREKRITCENAANRVFDRSIVLGIRTIYAMKRHYISLFAIKAEMCFFHFKIEQHGLIKSGTAPMLHRSGYLFLAGVTQCRCFAGAPLRNCHRRGLWQH